MTAPPNSPSALAQMTSPAVATSAPTLLVPLGSTEQHGAHLPLATDSMIANRLAFAAASGRDRTVVAPVMSFGASGEHQAFAGTLSIGTEALTLVLVELVRSAAHSFDRVVLVNGHGGNLDAVRTAVAQLHTEGHNVSSWFPTTDGDAHAGHTETSLLLHLAPPIVDMSKAEAGATEPLAELLPTMREHGVAGVSANGVLGDPTTATAAHGAELFATLVASLRSHLDSMASEQS